MAGAVETASVSACIPAVHPLAILYGSETGTAQVRQREKLPNKYNSGVTLSVLPNTLEAFLRPAQQYEHYSTVSTAKTTGPAVVQAETICLANCSACSSCVTTHKLVV